MKNIKLLDCTLRDGGRIIDCAFRDDSIRKMAKKLDESGIDIIELGFLRNHREYHGNTTFFTAVDQIRPFIPDQHDAMYVAFIDYGMCDLETIPPYDGTSIDGLRFGFTHKDKDNVYQALKLLKAKGYTLFVQGVNSLSYTDKELLEVVDMINEIEPYSFGIVDTYGAMYLDDLSRIYHLIDHNLKPEIAIDFHAHNNFQLAFALAQEIIRYSNGKRKLILDATLNGMGKCAGNLCTELIADYLNRKRNYAYDLDKILDVIDEHIYSIKCTHNWGYTIPAFMAGIYQAHPNNVIYLTEKLKMRTKDVKNILSLIDKETRTRYDYDNIEKIYIEYCSQTVDDSATIEKLNREIASRDVLVLSPGTTLREKYEQIQEYIQENHPFVITVNFFSSYDESSWAFFGNGARFEQCHTKRNGHPCMVTSNFAVEDSDVDKVNYHSVIEEGIRYFDNSTLMLLNLLFRAGAKRVFLAGFDGFDEKRADNYIDVEFDNTRYKNSFPALNAEIGKGLAKIFARVQDKMKIRFLTDSLYQNYLDGAV